MKCEDIEKEVALIVRERAGGSYQTLLFGSWARGDALPQSDIDIAIYGESEVPWPVMAGIRNAVEEIPTLRKIDVVDIMAKSADFRDAVLAYARPIAV